MFRMHLRPVAVWCCVALFILCGGRRVFGQAAAAAGGTFEALAQAASTAREAGRADEAIHDYSQAVALRPDWAEGWWYLGTMQYDRDRYADAIPALRQLVQIAPNLGAARAFLGLSEFETRDYDNSFADLQKAQSIGVADDPELAHVSAYHFALLLNRHRQFEQATALLLSTSGQSELPPQIKSALGMALLRIPLLPDQVDPSQDAFLQSAGEVAAAAARNPAQAVDVLGRLVNEHPQAPYLHYAYGLALATAGQTEEALAAQQRETEISPESVLPRMQIATLQLALHQFPAALRSAQQALALAPDSSAAHELLAKALEANGKRQQAADETRKAATLLPEKAQVDQQTAKIYGIASNAKPSGATSSGREPGSGKPSETNSAEWQRAMSDYASQHYAEAITALKKWVEEKPGDGTAWAVMGLAEFELRDYDNALIHLQRGQQLGVGASPQAIELAKYRLASLMLRKGQFEMATELLGPLAGQPPLAGEIQFALGLALLRIPSLPDEVDAARRPLVEQAGDAAQLLLASKYDQAFPKLQKLMEQYPTTPFLHYADGTALDSLSQYDEAKAQMRAEIRISPDSALPWTRLASIALRQRLPDEALPAAQNAVRLAPDSADAHYVLGRAWADSGDAGKAIPELERASQLSLDSPEIHFALAKAYAKVNQPEKASEERATFARLNALAEQQRAQHGGQAYQGAHDAANSSILGSQPNVQGAAPPH
jgi:predicted Zn-dependent protease